MTLTRYSAAKFLQALGVLLAGAGTLVAALSTYCGSSAHVSGGAAVVALGLAGLLIGRGDGAVPLALLGVVVLLATVSTGYSCRPILDPPPSIAPIGTAFAFLAASVVPSLMGAVLLRFAR